MGCGEFFGFVAFFGCFHTWLTGVNAWSVASSPGFRGLCV